MRRNVLSPARAAVAGLVLLLGAAPAWAQAITVHKTPWCGCCTAWADHLAAEGFAVTVEEHEDLTPVRARLGVPGHLQSCHTGEVAGYAIEGHVPAADIRRLLSFRLKARGLAVPGMPAGSPGMEVDGVSEPYDVLLFGEAGETVFASH